MKIKLLLSLIVTTTAAVLPIKIGYNDPGNCDTTGSAYDYSDIGALHLVSGQTKSQTLLYNDNTSPCLQNSIPFIQILQSSGTLQQLIYFDQPFQLLTYFGGSFDQVTAV